MQSMNIKLTYLSIFLEYREKAKFPRLYRQMFTLPLYTGFLSDDLVYRMTGFHRCFGVNNPSVLWFSDAR
jgi:hypothetical protein